MLLWPQGTAANVWCGGRGGSVRVGAGGGQAEGLVRAGGAGRVSTNADTHFMMNKIVANCLIRLQITFKKHRVSETQVCEIDSEVIKEFKEFTIEKLFP